MGSSRRGFKPSPGKPRPSNPEPKRQHDDHPDVEGPFEAGALVGLAIRSAGTSSSANPFRGAAQPTIATTIAKAPPLQTSWASTTAKPAGRGDHAETASTTHCEPSRRASPACGAGGRACRQGLRPGRAREAFRESWWWTCRPIGSPMIQAPAAECDRQFTTISASSVQDLGAVGAQGLAH